MKLLVLTPTLGTSPWLRETLSSVAALENSARHVLVAPERARTPLMALAPHAEFVRDEGAGVYAALNRGLAVGGEWDAFTWINDDDRLCPEAVSRSWKQLVATPVVEVTYGCVNYIDARGQSLGPLPVERKPARLEALFAAGLPALTQHGTLVRRALAERLGGFDGRYRLAADFDFWARALAAGARFEFAAEHLADYRLRAGQLSADVATVACEVAESVARVFPGADEKTKGRARRWFRVRRGTDLLRRFLRSGCWRTADLYRRAEGTLP